MKIVDFSYVEFKDIPKEDNPAFGKDECILICKTNECNRGSKFIVLHIKPVDDPYTEDSVHKKGIFWKMKYALLFANSLSRK